MPHADHVRGHALVVGHDHVLLHTRERMLAADGYGTDLVFDIEGASEALASPKGYDIVVLCHSVTEGERRTILARIGAMAAPVPIYAMTGADSPQQFTETVARLTGKRRMLREEEAHPTTNLPS